MTRLTEIRAEVLRRHLMYGEGGAEADGFDAAIASAIDDFYETAKGVAQPAPDHLGPDDHGHTGRLWCDPCVGHGVMLEQGIHRCAQHAGFAAPSERCYCTAHATNGHPVDDATTTSHVAQPAPDPLLEDDEGVEEAAFQRGFFTGMESAHQPVPAPLREAALAVVEEYNKHDSDSPLAVIDWAIDDIRAALAAPARPVEEDR